MKKVRGIWLTNVASKAFDSQSEIEAAIKLISETGFNVVFPVVWNKGFTLYPSKAMEKYFGASFKIDPKCAGRDPLAEIIETAKVYKLKVIPWFEYGFAASAIQKTATGTAEFGAHILEKQPKFAAIDHSGDPLIKPLPKNTDETGFRWMNALNSEVQAFMTDLILEVAQNYDIDGVQGDDRLPSFPVEGFDQHAAGQFRAKHGRSPTGATDSKWMQFRADILTQFLDKLCKQVRQVGRDKGKKLLISMAPHPSKFGFREYLQDTKAWLDLDLVDIMHPQLYRRTFGEYQTSVDEELSGLPTAHKSKISPGVLMKLDKYRIDKNNNHLGEAIRINRSTGFAGELFFFFEGLREPDNRVAKALRDELYAVNKLDDEGPDVFKIQSLLKANGVDPGEIDGIFGQKTENAVKDFQSRHFPPLGVDGKVGKDTLAKLGVASLQNFGNLPLP